MSTPPLKLKRSVQTRLLDQLPWYPQWRSLLVKLLYRDEWVLKVWGSELCFINAAMNSHTVWCNKKKTWNRRPSPHSLHYWAFFQHDNEDILSPKFKILQWTCISLNLNTLELLWGILYRRAEKLSIKDQSIEGGHPPGIKQDRCENLSNSYTVPRRVKAVSTSFQGALL